MKAIQLTISSLIVASVAVFASPAIADQPGTNEDPFGGYPILGIDPGGMGIVARFGLSPWGTPLPGGLASRNSGDGTSPRRAIYIGGIWGQSIGDSPVELANCATLKIPPGNFRWFKLDTWRDRRLRIWLDDELNGATQATGSSVFGAADQYMLGTAPGDAWQTNVLDKSQQTENFINGFVMAVYDPDNLRPMWSFNPPNAAILSVNTDGRGKLLTGPDNVSVKDATGAGIEGYASHNPGEPLHLLWYEGQFEGWVFVSVYNQMIWEDTASVCSQRLH
jgi:hypothetical protein